MCEGPLGPKGETRVSRGQRHRAPSERRRSTTLTLSSAGLATSQRLFVCVSLSKHLVASASTAASSSAAAATVWLSIYGCVRRMTNTASSGRSFSAPSVKLWMEELMNRQQRLLSRAAVRVIYQAGIIEARGDEWSAWPLAPPDNGPTCPPRPETPCYLACFPLAGHWNCCVVCKNGIKVSGRQVLKAPVCAKFTLPAFPSE